MRSVPRLRLETYPAKWWVNNVEFVFSQFVHCSPISWGRLLALKVCNGSGEGRAAIGRFQILPSSLLSSNEKFLWIHSIYNFYEAMGWLTFSTALVSILSLSPSTPPWRYRRCRLATDWAKQRRRPQTCILGTRNGTRNLNTAPYSLQNAL